MNKDEIEVQPNYFIAIRVPKQIQSNLYKLKENEAFQFKRWVHEKDIHLTVVYLGKCSAEQLTKIKKGISQLLSHWQPFTLELSTVGTFGRKEQPRVFWHGVKKEPVLYTYQKEVHQMIKGFGFPLDERPYAPHLTLARKWIGNEQYKEVIHDRMNDSWQVHELVLYETNVMSEPKYKVVGTFPFGDRR